ncbi:MAG TPA: hypothetical protein VF534_17805 [Paraburkholderia sp.]
MSILAKDLVELNALPLPHGTLTEHLLRELATNLIAPGCASYLAGC